MRGTLKEIAGSLLGVFVAGLILFLACLLSAPIFLVQAWVLSKLWGWFVASTFSLPDLTMMNALGIVLLVKVLKGFERREGKDSTKEESDDPLLTELYFTLGQILLYLTIALVGNFLYTYFM